MKWSNLISLMKSVCYVAHINVEVAIDDPQKLVDLIEYAAKCGAIYFAVNYKIKVCENSHLWVGSEDKCPKCGAEWKETITRVVGEESNYKRS